MRCLEGITRKVSLACLAISTIGWAVHVTGTLQNLFKFEELSDEFDPFNKYFIPLWISGISGLVVHLLAVCHSSTWGYCSSLLGSITAVFAVVYISALGYVTIYNGYFLVFNDDIKIEKDFDRNFYMMFAGGVVSAAFWALYQAFWPWYKKQPEEERDYSTI